MPPQKPKINPFERPPLFIYTKSMAHTPTPSLATFHFHNLHPQICIGTASDRYAGSIGEIYSEDRYTGRITKRTRIIAWKTFIEEVLPIDSVEEYFDQHNNLY
jgi:hypothetical protein